MFQAQITKVQNGFIVTVNSTAYVVENLDGDKEGFEEMTDLLRKAFYNAMGIHQDYRPTPIASNLS